MQLNLRNHLIVILLSLLFSFIFYFDCYADEEIIESEVFFDDSAEFEPDQSDIVPDSPGQSFTNLYVENLIVSPSEELEPEEEEEEIYILSSPDEAQRDILPIIPRDNTVLYFGSFGGRDCWALFPLSVADSLITVNGVLINIGANNVTGRVFYSDSLDLSSYDLSFLTLVSQFSTNLPTSVYNYQYGSYVRAYSSNGQRLVYSDSYGNFIVSDIVPTFDNTRSQTEYYILIVICLFVGSGFIFTRLSRR